MTEYLLVNEQSREFALISEEICDQICKHVESDDLIYDLLKSSCDQKIRAKNLRF